MDSGAVCDGALVGAFERDNFGDLLFLDATRGFLDGGIATAPSAGDTRAFGGESIRSYFDLFSKERAIEYVWTVGGEVGSTTMEGARRMSGEAHYGDVFTAGLNDHSPYVPRMSTYESTFSSPYVINSVGLAGLSMLRGVKRIELLGAVREATFVSVRDRTSSRLLNRLGIEHSVAPDIVHAHAEEMKEGVSPIKDVALIQCSSEVIGRIGTRRFARYLAESPALRGMRLRLFSAGSAPGHDSIDDLLLIREHLDLLTAPDRTEISESTSAVQRAQEIAGSGLWIGTSLHGFILATSFGVPRVGIELDKVAQYARSWGIEAPAGVPISGLGAATEAALSKVGRDLDFRIGADLGVRARENARAAAASLDSSSRTKLAGERLASAARISGEVSRFGPSSKIRESGRVAAARIQRRFDRIAAR